MDMVAYDSPMSVRLMAWDISRRVLFWARHVFGENNSRATDPQERGLRFLEEALELVQCDEVGVTREQAYQLVDYVFGRPVGVLAQEVGGVGVTWANLCGVLTVDLVSLTETELERIQRPEIVDKIRVKQVTKTLAGIGGSPVTEKGIHGG